MIRPWIEVARPRDWTGAAVRWALVCVGVVLVLFVLLVRLPAAWVDLARGSPDVVRLFLLLVLLWALRWLGALVYARLPRAASLFRQLTFRERGQRRRVRIEEISRVDVELRPPPVHQIFVVELRDGTTHDVCPTDWPGAGRLYAKLARKIARAHAQRSPEKSR